VQVLNYGPAGTCAKTTSQTSDTGKRGLGAYKAKYPAEDSRSPHPPKGPP